VKSTIVPDEGLFSKYENLSVVPVKNMGCIRRRYLLVFYTSNKIG
jgi:hypothetical protein